MLYRHGVGRVPLWVEILQAAEDWGVPPWELAPERSKTTWFARWQFIRRERARAEKDKAESEDKPRWEKR